MIWWIIGGGAWAAALAFVLALCNAGSRDPRLEPTQREGLILEFPGHDRRQQRRLERALAEDLPGAPPGFLLDPEDRRSPCTADEAPNQLVDADDNPLARGAGEDD